MKFKLKVKHIISIAVTAVVLAVFIVVDVLAGLYSEMITGFLCGTGVTFDNASEALKQSDALVQQIEEEGITLLKNDGVLPLKSDERKINVFGYGSTENGFLMRGLGSGSSTIRDEKAYSLVEFNGTTNQGALSLEGFEVNPEIYNIFKNFNTDVRPKVVASGNVYNLNEPDVSAFTPDIMARAKEYSDIALMVISRCAGENAGEIPDSYLDITAKEQAIVDLMTANFSKVIIVLNTSNTMHAGFLNNDNIGAAITVGLTGQSGALAIPRILKGEKSVDVYETDANGETLKDADGNPVVKETTTVKVSPSGKLADVMTYNNQYDPTYANRAPGGNGIQYSEGIYYGYKWYETADAEDYFASVSNTYGNGYDGVVQYPFGYGLSYTDFAWELESAVEVTGTDNNDEEITAPFASGSFLTLNSTGLDSNEIVIKVLVKNTGSYDGKDTVQLYYTPPYTGNVERAEVNLLDFGKTFTLEAGEDKSQLVELRFSAYDMAAWDVNANGGKGAYVLEAGDYVLSFRTDSHTLKEDMPTITYKVSSTIELTKDNVSGNDVQNRFTGSTAYAGCPTDGSTVNTNQSYMTRADFAGTFPRSIASQNAPSSTVKNFIYTNPNLTANGDYNRTPTDSNIRLTKVKGTSDIPTMADLTGNGRDIEYDMDLLKELWDYDSDQWELLLNQLTRNEIRDVIENGGFKRQAIESIGKHKTLDFDGPAGFNTNTIEGNSAKDTGKWTAFTSECLMGQTWNKDLMFSLGRSMAAEGSSTNIYGWYAPGVNLHRSAYTARNYEYYSEDGVLSGELAANVIYGAKTNGMICYLKHFVCSEEGPNPRNVNTWITEQNLRENYLRPFEIAVKEGGANGMMTAFNNVGANWCGANGALVTEVLRGEWNFKGVVITDWCDGGATGSYGAGKQGVRAGNDLWLNPGTLGGTKYSDSDAMDITSARYAVKNIIYAQVDAVMTQDSVKDVNFNDIKAEIGTGFADAVFPWWIPVLAVVEVLAVCGCGVWVFLMFFRDLKKKSPKAVEATAGEGAPYGEALPEETPVEETPSEVTPSEETPSEETPSEPTPDTTDEN